MKGDKTLQERFLLKSPIATYQNHFNPFLANVSILYPRKTPENLHKIFEQSKEIKQN